MGRIRRILGWLRQPRVLRAIGVAYLLGLFLSVGVAWFIAGFLRMAPEDWSLTAMEGSEIRTISISRSAVSLTVEVTKELAANWSPEQATGAPDTSQMGDIVTAWASLSPDSQDEWLDVEFISKPVAQWMVIHETFNPGAVSQITAIDPSSMEQTVWTGNDPAALTPQGIHVAQIPFDRPVTSIWYRIHLDSKRVAGWNEIDAVGLVDNEGKTHWATAARASSTYASRSGASLLTFKELDSQVPYWVETDGFTYGMNGITYEAHGWPFLSLYGQNPDSTGQRIAINPIRPIWPGLLANAAIYGGALMLLYSTITFPRQFLTQSLRLRRGQCMECGYDLQFDLLRGCPECGWRREVAERDARERELELERRHREGYARNPAQPDEFMWD